MTKFVALAVAPFTALAALALAGCGSADSAKEQAQADNVEMPAEEAMPDDPNATPVADASAAAGAELASPPAPAAAAKP